MNVLSKRILPFLLPLAMVWSPPAQADRQQITLPTINGSVLIETFASEVGGMRPAIVVLSGAKGFDAPVYDEMARTLGAAGLDVFLVHFLSAADLKTIESAGSARARIRYYAEQLPAWSAAVDAAVSYLEADPSHGGRVGVLGISLGAQIAAAAMANNTEIRALVLVDGGFPNNYAEPIASMPPLHLIWGGADQTFPLIIGQDLKQMVEGLGGVADLNVYEGAGHDFFVRSGTRQGNAAREDAADFLARALGQ